MNVITELDPVGCQKFFCQSITSFLCFLLLFKSIIKKSLKQVIEKKLILYLLSANFKIIILNNKADKWF